MSYRAASSPASDTHRRRQIAAAGVAERATAPCRPASLGPVRCQNSNETTRRAGRSQHPLAACLRSETRTTRGRSPARLEPTQREPARTRSLRRKCRLEGVGRQRGLRGAVVVLEQAAESFAALNRSVLIGGRVAVHEECVVEPLVISFEVIVLDEVAHGAA